MIRPKPTKHPKPGARRCWGRRNLGSVIRWSLFLRGEKLIRADVTVGETCDPGVAAMFLRQKRGWLRRQA